MAPIFHREITALFQEADRAKSHFAKGLALEKAVRRLFSRVPGIELAASNVKNAANTEEVDVLFWNARSRGGLYQLETPFLVECKNWGKKVSGQAVVYFANTLRGRGCRDGILVASSGITGDAGKLTEAHYEIAYALRKGQRILVLNRIEIENLRDATQLSSLLKRKILDLAIRGTKVL